MGKIWLLILEKEVRDMKEPEEILICWVEREVDHEYPHNSDLSQLLWRATKYVRCGEASKSLNGGMCHIKVCHYARPGISRVHTHLQTTCNICLPDHVISNLLF